MKVVQKKVCLLGDFAVGKTSLVRRFVEGRFDDKYLSTIGVKVSRKTVERPDHQLNFLLWDLVGGNEFSRSETGYLLGTAGALIVCDLTRENTLTALTRYSNQLRAVNPNAKIILLGNKVDLVDQREITDEQLMDVCAITNSEFLLTSAKTGEAVETTFLRLAEKMEGEER